MHDGTWYMPNFNQFMDNVTVNTEQKIVGTFSGEMIDNGTGAIVNVSNGIINITY